MEHNAEDLNLIQMTRYSLRLPKLPFVLPEGQTKEAFLGIKNPSPLMLSPTALAPWTLSGLGYGSH